MTENLALGTNFLFSQIFHPVIKDVGYLPCLPFGSLEGQTSHALVHIQSVSHPTAQDPQLELRISRAARKACVSRVAEGMIRPENFHANLFEDGRGYSFCLKQYLGQYLRIIVN